MKIQASERLQAVQVKPNAYPDRQGLEDLDEVTRAFSRKPKVFLGKNGQGLTFWWTRGKKFLVCADGDTVVAYIQLFGDQKTVHLNEKIKARQISLTFTHPDYRGRGVMLGMHQYLITQFNLLSDDLYSPEGLNIWKHLKKIGHSVEVVNTKSRSKSWTEPSNLLLVRRGQ